MELESGLEWDLFFILQLITAIFALKVNVGGSPRRNSMEGAPKGAAEDGSPGGGSSARNSPHAPFGSSFQQADASQLAASNRPPSLPQALSLTRWGSTGAMPLMHPAPALVHSGSGSRMLHMQSVSSIPLQGNFSGPSTGMATSASPAEGGAVGGSNVPLVTATQLDNPLYNQLSVDVVSAGADHLGGQPDSLRGGEIGEGFGWEEDMIFF